ncbi:uncharacterized protein FRV6_07571 [Fusarium oxysporum]|uniref:Uncharacterized protein n=2 Tax=Fusarium oxysporum TaxID=5507 RepID=A0A2H3T3Y6_FUSOX|nr:hypothetical protein FOXB_00464 [Fusarium oxysporum f. sp. conglutinans Fo5176]SCO83358.1 uncharacterized protein FRV6_07571 [Fusarium oxysporum]
MPRYNSLRLPEQLSRYLVST